MRRARPAYRCRSLRCTDNCTDESAELSALPLFVPEIDYSAGRLDTSVTIGGTLGQPRFNGDFAIRDGRFELYRTNLVLSNASLDGRFAGDELKFEGGGNLASGVASLKGHFTWPGRRDDGSDAAAGR